MIEADLKSGVALTEGQAAVLLDSAEVPPPTTTWRSGNVGTMMRRGALCGWRDFDPGSKGSGAMVAQGDWAPILGKEVVDQIRAILDNPARSPKGRRPRHYLTGLLRCAECGSRMSGDIDNRSKVRRYSCTWYPGSDRCGKNTVKAEPVEELVAAAILEVLSDAAFRSGKRNLASSADLAEATQALTLLDQEEREWQDDLRGGRIDRPTFMNALDGIRERRKPLEQIIGAASPTVTRALAGVPVEREEVERWWQAADVERQRRVARALIDHVTINKGQRGGNRFDPARVEPPAWRA